MSNGEMKNRLEAEMEVSAYAIAAGTNAFADVGVKLFTASLTEDDVDSTYGGDYYKRLRLAAEKIAIARGKPLKAQTDRSLASQMTKMGTFPKLGEFARTRNGDDVEQAFAYARERSEAGYTKLVKCAVAMNKALAKNRAADYAELCDAIDKAMADEPETASEAVTKMLTAWDKLTKGDEKKGEFKHERAFASLLASYPQDYAEHVARTMRGIVKELEKMEKASEESDLPTI